MSQFNVELSMQAAAPQWGKEALLSFSEDKIVIHMPVAQKEQLRAIQRAARTLDDMNLSQLSLTGDWQAEQQWAFACSFSSAKKAAKFYWCEDDNKQQLSNGFEALLFTRKLINSTPEELSPLTLANEASEWLASLAGESISTKMWMGEELAQQGWTGIYNVGRGSSRPPVLVEIDYNPGGKADTPVSAALVGKGITFDSGGYSIKSSEGMLDMKCDMGGAATVSGALGLAILNGLDKRVKLYLCCAENLISGHAYKLGDILTYKNGVSVEIVNTDAEGRLVLADGLLAASATGAPLIINAATLTGAAVVALGGDYNAVFALDKPLQQRILNYAEQENELAWPLPLEVWHREKCPSNFADTANSRAQKGGGSGGASNAAGFLSRFVNNDGKGWIHFDLAAAYNGSSNAYLPAGATGIGIRTIARALLEE
jgi:PepB aminopeptidase